MWIGDKLWTQHSSDFSFRLRGLCRLYFIIVYIQSLDIPIGNQTIKLIVCSYDKVADSSDEAVVLCGVIL